MSTGKEKVQISGNVRRLWTLKEKIKENGTSTIKVIISY